MAGSKQTSKHGLAQLNIETKIIIVGAGVAGLAAARRLLLNGFTNVIILEAQERVGGRVFTQRLDNNPIEIGAQWIHGEVGNPVFSLAQEHNLLGQYDVEPVTALDAEFRTQYGECLNTHLARDFEIIMASVVEECREAALVANISSTASPIDSKSDRSALAFFERKFSEYLKSATDLPKSALIKDGLFNWWCLFRNTIEGCDTLSEMSMKSFGDYQELEGNPVVELRDGYDRVLEVLLKDIPEDVIQLNKAVRAIHCAKPIDGKLPEGKLPVNILCQDGDAIQAQHVIVTCSLGYLKRSINTMFLPPAPEAKKLAVMNLGFGTVNKIFIKFEKSFWPPDSAGYSFVWLDETPERGKAPPTKPTLSETWQKGIVGFYTLPKQPNVLYGWIAGKEARHMETLDDSEVMETCLGLLRLFTRELLPPVVKFIRSAWYSNPYTLGSYSYKTQQSDSLADPIADLAAPITMMLEEKSIGALRQHAAVLFAGEATHPLYYSTVHGALLSGYREADRICMYYKALMDEIEREVFVVENYKGIVSRHRVIIVGAGISGLAAAQKLIEDGIQNVKILEASCNAGGRIRSIPYGNGFLELGAQWIHGEVNNDVHLFATKNKLLAVGEYAHSPEGEGQFWTQDGENAPLALVQTLKDVILDIFEECAVFAEPEQEVSAIPSSVGAYVQQRFEEYLEKCMDPAPLRHLKRGLFDWLMCYACIDNACNSMHDLSARYWGEYEECDGNPRVNLLNGYQSVVETLMQQLPADTVSLNCAVKTISWDREPLTIDLIHTFDSDPSETLTAESSSKPSRRGQDSSRDPTKLGDFTGLPNRIILGLKRFVRHPDTYPIEVTCENGNRYLCEHIIITVSVGVLKTFALSAISPALPNWKLRTIGCMGFGTINKIFLVFQEPFWPRDCQGFQLVWTDKHKNINADGVEVDSQEELSEKPWYRNISGFDVVHQLPNVLLAWVGSGGAEAVESLSDQEVSSTCIQLLRRFTRIADIPEPVQVIRSAWHNDRFIQGAYSYRSVQCESDNLSVRDLTEPIHLNVENLRFPLILFAGEATDVRYYATVHGAFTSGYREADRLVDFYRVLKVRDQLEEEQMTDGHGGKRKDAKFGKDTKPHSKTKEKDSKDKTKEKKKSKGHQN